jgi:hypothetical protein
MPGALGAALVVTVAPLTHAPASALAPDTRLAYHGSVAMTAGIVDVRLTPHNRGPRPVTAATVRLRWSAPLTDRQRLPDGCARAGARTVICGTGPLAADATGAEIALRVRLRGAPAEVHLDIDTAWRGDGPADRRHHHEDRLRVLALDTGDAYAF